MFCSKCGNEVSDNALFCSECGNTLRQEFVDLPYNNGLMLTPGFSWAILAICFLMLIVGLSVGMSYEGTVDSKDLIIPIIFSLISLGASAFVLSNSKKRMVTNKEYKGIYIASIIIVVLGALLAFEVCIGPFIGELTKKR